MDEVLVCLSSGFTKAEDEQDLESETLKLENAKIQTIACLSSIEYEFQRENIKKAKSSLIKMISKQPR